jgi:predicted ATPase
MVGLGRRSVLPEPGQIVRVTLTNLLSFGPEGETLELGPLNVLIGANGSGKSNLVDALTILRATPGDLAEPFRLPGHAAYCNLSPPAGPPCWRR